MATAQFVLVGFASAREPAIAEWHQSADAVRALAGAAEDAAVLPAGAGALVGWRLVAANSRVLARSPRFFATDGEARASIAALVRDAEHAPTRLIAAPALRGFGWYAAGPAAGEAMSARWYEGRAIAQNAAGLVHRILLDKLTRGEPEPSVLTRLDVSSAPRSRARRR